METLAVICNIAEVLAAFPDQLAFAQVLMLPKPNGGSRPVGLLPPVVRLWEAARRTSLQDWCLSLDRPWLSCSAGRSPDGTVWRLSVRAEHAVAKGLTAGAVCWDLHKCFDTVPHGDALAGARNHGMPRCVADLAFSVFRSKRYISAAAGVADPVQPRCGIVAGSRWADPVLKAFYLDLFDSLHRDFPEVHLEVYIDDIAFVTFGDLETVAQRLRGFAAQARLRIEGAGLTIAWSKAAVAASGAAAARYIAVQIEKDHPPHQIGVDLLGIPFALGAPRRTTAAGRAARFEKGIVRKHRLKFIAARLPRGRNRVAAVARAAVAPIMAYGAAALGLAPNEAKRIRSATLALAGPVAGGASLTAKVCVHGDPSEKPFVSPLRAWAAEVFAAAVAPKAHRLSLRWLCVAWAAVRPDRPGKWPEARGPLALAARVCEHIGWTFSGPTRLTTHTGRVLELKCTAPAMVEDLALEALRERSAKDFAAKLGAPAGSAVDVASLRAALRGIATPHKRGLATALLCNAVWTRGRAADCGYDIDRRCQHCGEDDSLEHRLLHCPLPAAAALRAALPGGALHGTNGRADLLAVPLRTPRSMAPVQPQPPCSRGDPADQRITHWFVDGSCGTEAIAEARRAGWAAVGFDDEGVVRHEHAAALDPLHAQTPQAAEHQAAWYAMRHAGRGATIHSDCQGVVDGAGSLSDMERLRYGGLVAAMRGRAGHTGVVVHKVKAHACERGLGGWQLFAAQGNNSADRLANSGRLLAPPPSLAALCAATEARERAALVLPVLADMLVLWDRVPRGLVRLPTGPALGHLAVGHDWVRVGRRWRCSSCWRTAGSRARGNAAAPRLLCGRLQLRSNRGRPTSRGCSASAPRTSWPARGAAPGRGSVSLRCRVRAAAPPRRKGRQLSPSSPPAACRRSRCWGARAR